MKQINFQAFKAHFHTSVHDKLERLWENPETEGLVLFMNNQFDSSQFGTCSAVSIGKNCTYKSWEDCQGKHLNDLPSQRQYAEYFCLK